MPVRKISTKKITETVRDLCLDANFNLGEDMVRTFEKAAESESSPLARKIFNELIENAKIARKEKLPLCQDCGIAVIFIDIGQDVCITDGNIKDAIYEGVRTGYEQGFLRKSMCHPLTRRNTGDNLPAIVHFDIVPGDKITINLLPKGGGSENMSRIKMMTPASGIKDIKEFVLNTVKESGANPCPPTIIGIGIGGSFERSAILARKALLRNIGTRNPEPELAKYEEEILEAINRLGIGPMGYGGRYTSLDVFIEMEPCHIASLPVAININCHSARHKQAVI